MRAARRLKKKSGADLLLFSRREGLRTKEVYLHGISAETARACHQKVAREQSQSGLMSTSTSLLHAPILPCRLPDKVGVGELQVVVQPRFHPLAFWGAAAVLHGA